MMRVQTEQWKIRQGAYIIGESLLLFGVMVTLLLHYGASGRTLRCSWLAWVTLVSAGDDAQTGRIPRELLRIGFVGALGIGLLDPAWLCGLSWLPGGPGIGIGLLLFVVGLERYRGVPLMGGADIQLVGFTGIFLGWSGNWSCLLLAASMGVLYGWISRRRQFPWGPCIAAAAWIVMLVGEVA